jgi:ferric-dicitrate binding protein FerR (iron transport regulator)/TolA-binding protein
MSRPSAPESDRDALFRSMGKLAKDTWNDESAPAHDAAERARLEAAVASGKGRRSGGNWVMRLAAAAVVACVLAVVVGLAWPSPLGYIVARSSSSVGGYLQAGAAAPATAAFTDGTEVRVAPGGRARIVETDRHGARLALEQGRATLSVVHRPGARWSVEAGPFTIAVTGTEFDAIWSGVEERLVVELRKGSVTVSGPLAVNGIGLVAGQRLVASVRDGQIHIEPLERKEATTEVAARGDPGAPSAPLAVTGSGAAPTGDGLPSPEIAAEPSATSPGTDATARVSPENPIPPTKTAQGVAPVPATETNWEKRVRAGDFTGVLQDAEARGVDATLETGSRSDLTALADAARYTGNASVAERALAAVEKRFPGSADSRAAPFLLGRLAEARGAKSEAIALYDRYLTESPHGSFVAEALGRKMLVVQAREGRSAARALARDYLVRFPKGPYADPARKLVDSE